MNESYIIFKKQKSVILKLPFFVSIEKIETFSQFLNILALVKSWIADESEVDFLSISIEALHVEKHCVQNENAKITFLLEQLKLVNKKKFSKTYSPELSIFAFLLYSTSATAYRILLDQDLLSLPSICTLNKITRKVDSRSSLNDNSYLKLRCSQLDQIHRNVIMLIDEIYITKRVELSHGDLIGLASNNEPASTLLCFMI